MKIFNHSILVHNLPGYICESIKSTLIFNKSENENIRFRKLKLKFANPAGNQKFFQKKNDKSIRNKEIGPIRIQRFFSIVSVGALQRAISESNFSSRNIH